MRRKPLLLALTAIVCLALCVALAGVQVYVRNGAVLEAPSWMETDRAWGRFDGRGLVIVWTIAAPNEPHSESYRDGMGFYWGWIPNPQTQTTNHFVQSPYWFLYTLLLVAPGGWVWGRYRRRRGGQGRGFPVVMEGERQPNG